MRIEIINWAKYNQRKDVKAPSWFRMDHGIFENPEFYDFSHTDIVAWLYLLCVASRKSAAIIEVNFTHAERIGRLKRKELEVALEKLERIQVVRVDVTDTLRTRYADVTSGPATLHNKTDKTDITEQDTATSGVPPVIASLISVAGVGLIQGVKTELQESWVSQYDAAWVCTEIRKAEAWCMANPLKRPKSSFARFMNNWLSRAWEFHRKTLPSQPVPSGQPSPVQVLPSLEERERTMQRLREQAEQEAREQGIW